jgi:uncharacterized membrane protein
MLAVLLSLAAAATFALGSLNVAGVSPRVGALQLVRWQMTFACVMTGAIALALGGFQTVTAEGFLWLLASSATGGMIGGLTYIAAIQTLGPRLFALFFTLSAPFALILGYLFRDETVTLWQGIGVVLILAGIVLAILGPRAAPRRGPGTGPGAGGGPGAGYGADAGAWQPDRPPRDAGRNRTLCRHRHPHRAGRAVLCRPAGPAAAAPGRGAGRP